MATFLRVTIEDIDGELLLLSITPWSRRDWNWRRRTDVLLDHRALLTDGS